MMGKLGKTVGMFLEIEHIKNWGVTFRIRLVFPKPWRSHDVGQYFLTELMTAP
jgi:hypothetical protein